MRSFVFRQIASRSASRFAQPKQTPFAVARSLTTYYTESHEYIKLEGDVGIIGVTAHAADALGDVVFVELPSVGSDIDVESPFGSVESVKAASDLHAPVNAEVIAVNTELEGSPGLVNESPYGTGWFIKVKLTEASKKQASAHMNEEKYAEFCANE